MSVSVEHEPIVQVRARPRGERQRRNWQLLPFVVLTLVALTVVPFMILRPRNQTYTLRNYETAVVEVGSLVEYARGSGSLSARLERTVTAPAVGTVVEWLVGEGDTVRAGQALGFLESSDVIARGRDAQQALDTARRDLEQTQLEARLRAGDEARSLASLTDAVERARTDHDLSASLFAAGAISRTQHAEAEARLAVAQAAVTLELERQAVTSQQRRLTQAAAEDRVARALEQVDQVAATEQALALHAPIGGLVVSIGAAAGERVAMDRPLVRIASTSDPRVTASLFESVANRMTVGQRALLHMDGEAYPGRVVQVAPQAQAGFDGIPSVMVTLDFDESPEELRLGGSVSIEVEVGSRENTLYLPRGPYLTTGSQRFVYVVKGETAIRQIVIYGLVDGNRVEVVEGLAEGDEIITSSYEPFKEHPEIELAPGGAIR